ENNAGRTRTATSDSPPHCRSSLAYSRRSNETIRSHDTRYRQNTLENPGGLGRLRWLPSKRGRAPTLNSMVVLAGSGGSTRLSWLQAIELADVIGRGKWAIECFDDDHATTAA